MSTPKNRRREHPSTYFVQDRSNEEELTRVQLQDQMTTVGMGGVLPEQPDPAIFCFLKRSARQDTSLLTARMG